ncbi:MAG: prepilin-type N-terminal cleavage/methylation domain-containing protein [Methylacidiphilales bacterium]|nr:prepilin-type N-terminal cleavage/methylation domain-containing protein [Candidatus Methylacidiphilales bacterium]
MIIFRRQVRPSSFTLIEMLTVIAIIAILAALILWAGSAVMAAGARARTTAEIQGMSSALEGYKTDNGAYPSYDMGTSSNYGVTLIDPSVAGGSFQESSTNLYQALSGQTNFTQAPVGNKVYFQFKGSQLGNLNGTSAAGGTYVQDPFGFSYGYNTGGGANNDVPYNGSGFFDLWSTAGVTSNTVVAGHSVYATNSWIDNWAQ